MAMSVHSVHPLQEEKQGKRKAHDSPESRRHKRPSHGPPNALDWGHHPAGPAAYDSPQRMQRAYLPPRAAGASPQARAHGKSSKSAGSPHRVCGPDLHLVRIATFSEKLVKCTIPIKNDFAVSKRVDSSQQYRWLSLLHVAFCLHVFCLTVPCMNYCQAISDCLYSQTCSCHP